MAKLNRISTTTVRLQEAMKASGKRQIDLVNETKLNRSTISRYVSGECEPKADAINKLALSLNVDEMWLWGYDVPMEKEKIPTEETLTDGEKVLLELFRQVPEKDQRMLVDMIRAVLSNRK